MKTDTSVCLLTALDAFTDFLLLLLLGLSLPGLQKVLEYLKLYEGHSLRVLWCWNWTFSYQVTLFRCISSTIYAILAVFCYLVLHLFRLPSSCFFLPCLFHSQRDNLSSFSLVIVIIRFVYTELCMLLTLGLKGLRWSPLWEGKVDYCHCKLCPLLSCVSNLLWSWVLRATVRSLLIVHFSGMPRNVSCIACVFKTTCSNHCQ